MTNATANASSPAAHSSVADWSLILVPGIIWGASFLFIAEGLRSVGPMGVTLVRVAVGFAALAFFRAAWKPIERKDWGSIVALGVLWMAFPLAMFPFAEQRISSALAGMLNGIVPLSTTIIAALIARRLPTRGIQLGLAIGLVGGILMAIPDLGDASSAAGIAMVVIACISYGFAPNIARPLQMKYGALPVIWRAQSVAFLILLPLGFRDVANAEWHLMPVLSLLALGALGTGVAHVVFATAAGRIGAAKASASAFLIPPVSLLLGVLVRDEHVAQLAVAGGALCVAGAWVMRRENLIVRAPAKLAALIVFVGLGSCAPARVIDTAAPSAPGYLFSWTGDEDCADSDFMTVIDLAPASDSLGARYGTIVATAPVGEKGLWPHHTEHSLGASGMLFANGYSANRSFLFDMRDALRPRVVERFDGGGADLAFLHSFERLPNGHLIATFQANGAGNTAPGGIAELDERGRVLRSRSAADPTADQTTLRPYSLAIVPALDRIVVALTFMPIPTWHPLRPSIEHDHSGNQVQVYRLSDLALLKTIRLAADEGPNEPRVLRDGRTVLVNTGACKLYRVTGLDGRAPALEMVHAEATPGCSGPVVIGDYWVQANAIDRRVFSLDVSDPSNVRRVSSVEFDARQRPHWLASDGARIVMLNEPGAQWERRMWMLRLDPATGRIALDSAFRDAGSRRPGIGFDRALWPHGPTGTAVPHGTVFDR